MSLIDNIRTAFGSSANDMRTYSPLSFAFIGDSIYGLVIKTVITDRNNCPANLLNKETVRYVNAKSQAMFYEYCEANDFLSEQESDIMRRGRNAKSYTKAKNASMGDYRKATGVEALVGYLYMTGDEQRLIEIVRKCMECVDREEER